MTATTITATSRNESADLDLIDRPTVPSCTLDDPDSDDEWGTDSYQDEPITSKNGLKENRVRGPRMSWALLDPSLGGILPQPYKTVPGFEPEPEPELSSPSTSDSSCESSLPSPSSLSNMEGRTVSEIRCRENNDDGDTYDIEYTDPVDDTGESDLVRKNSKSKASLSAGAISSTSSPFALIKSYVPSLPTFNDPTSGSTAGAEKRTSGTGGFWSMRRLSMNLLNNNQYAQLDTPETANKERTSYAVEGQEEDEEGVMEEETQGYSRYKDDDTLCDTKVDSYKRFSGSNFRKEKGSTNRPTSLVVSPTTTSNSYFASMLNSASNAVSSKGSKAKKIGRSD
ncbi:hypothetical protein BGX28_003450 [Mortierella sp. GBA30]|nr:hypothetical protein BGX28_003450 [Mortierella sp. GBA30]